MYSSGNIKNTSFLNINRFYWFPLVTFLLIVCCNNYFSCQVSRGFGIQVLACSPIPLSNNVVTIFHIYRYFVVN